MWLLENSTYKQKDSGPPNMLAGFEIPIFLVSCNPYSGHF
jgi:hypothetical protein